MIKTHNVTGLKYLCVTKNEDHNKYHGSGVYWKKHLRIHGRDIDTEIIFSTESKNALAKAGIKYSALYDVVESCEWANLISETGYDYDGITRKGWFGWYESLTENEIKERNINISKKVRDRFANEDSKITSERNSASRRNISPENALQRKSKIQDVYATGKHDHLFVRYSEERQGANNPAAQSVSIEGIIYHTIKDAFTTLELTRSVVSNRIKSDSKRWAKWYKII